MSKFYQYSNSICHWPKEDRPRERLIKYGEHTLTNAELLAILLRTGVKGTSALDLARRILKKFGTLRNLSHTDASAWREFKGLGPAKIAQIKAAIEIGRRFTEEENRVSGAKIKSARDAADLLMQRMRDLKTEVFKVIYLNGAHQVIEISDESTGTVNFASPIVREIFKKALERFAVSIVCAHNHPSGDCTPSPQDRQFTQKIVEAGKIMQVKVLDHIIIGDNKFYSFAEEGGMGG